VQKMTKPAADGMQKQKVRGLLHTGRAHVRSREAKRQLDTKGIKESSRHQTPTPTQFHLGVFHGSSMKSAVQSGSDGILIRYPRPPVEQLEASMKPVARWSMCTRYLLVVVVITVRHLAAAVKDLVCLRNQIVFQVFLQRRFN
jgi:hypothetical protein